MNIDFTRIVDNRVDKCSSRKGGNSRLNNLTVNLEFRACESVSNLLPNKTAVWGGPSECRECTWWKRGLCGEGRGSVPVGSVGCVSQLGTWGHQQRGCLAAEQTAGLEFLPAKGRNVVLYVTIFKNVFYLGTMPTFNKL